MARPNRTTRRPALVGAAALAAALLIATATPAAAHTPYVVQAGDSLSVIARDHGVSTAALAEANGIRRYDFIRIGQTLQVPVHGATTYTIVAGDTVGQIARKLGVSSADLIALNEITDPNRIRAGQELRVPTGSTAAPTASPAPASTGRYPSLPSRIRSNPDRLALVPSFERWAAHYGVPADLLMAVAYQESGWQTSVVSHKGAIGIGQLLPATADWVAEDLIGIPSLDPNNPDDNIRMSARFLLWLIGYLGSEDAALAGYYQGPGSVTIRGLYEETQAYIANVQGARWRFQVG
ncbi:MAG: lytic transglycosylase [Acidimicrobiales bacterium]